MRSLVARWASSTNWLFLVGAFRYLLYGDPIVKGVFVANYKLPDFSHYLGTRGASYVLRTGLHGNDTFIPFNLEYVYKGHKSVEATVGYRAIQGESKNGYGVSIALNSDGGYGLLGDASIGISKSVSLGFGLSYFSQKSMLGERLIQRYISSSSGGYDLWAKVSAKY